MKKLCLRRCYGKIVNALSFSPELYKLRRELNARIDMPGTISIGPRSHPFGVTRWFKKRRISIAEAYLTIVRDLESSKSKARLRALRKMMDVSLHARTVDLPLNTARVQIALIKETVRNRGNRRKQLEFLEDFTLSSHGQYHVIRKLLEEQDLVELPERNQSLKHLDAGWDDHVHDTASAGRKSPTQLLVDAFIKGVSRLTIAFDSAESVDLMEEALEAGKIVGIKVRVAFDFSAIVQGRRFHFMAVLPHFKKAKDLRRWFKENAEPMAEFFDGLKRNQQCRIDAVKELLRAFNETSLARMNEGYSGDDIYSMRKLRFQDLREAVPEPIMNPSSLGDMLYSRYRPILFNRVLLARALREKALREWSRKRIDESRFRFFDEQHDRLRQEYRDLDPESLKKQYFSYPSIGDYSSVFVGLEGVKCNLAKAGCSIRVLRPLEHGFAAAKTLLESYRGIIDQVEIFNIRDYVDRGSEEMTTLAQFLNSLNAQSNRVGLTPYVPVVGSDSTGRAPWIPGMGFLRADRINRRGRNKYLKRHIQLPPIVSALIESKDGTVEPESLTDAPVVVSLGRSTVRHPNLIGDEEESDSSTFPLSRVWRYLNPTLVNLCYILTGTAIGVWYIGAFYAILWSFITGFRNSIAYLVASRGIRINAWRLRSINFGNVARSIFWSGLSVPILGFVKEKFDDFWPWGQEEFLFEAAKFFVISLSNGVYLATHNTLRGFDRSVIKANSIRSFLAWPLATIAAPFGNLLGVPAIVQSKIWSDFVGGFIEGGSKYRKLIRLRRRDLEEIVPRVVSEDEEERYTALVDLLFLFREEPRTAGSLRTALNPRYRHMSFLKLEAEGPVCPYGTLRTILDDPGLDRALADFILSKNEPEAALEVLKLVEETLPRFRDWIRSNERFFRSRGGPWAKGGAEPIKEAAAEPPGPTGYAAFPPRPNSE